MNGSRSKPLSRGPSVFDGSLEGKIIVALVVIAVIIAAVAFALYSTVRSQEAALSARQSDYDAISTNFSQLSGDYAALNASYARLSANYTLLGENFHVVKANYENVSAQYGELQNRTSLVDTRLNSFLENEPTIAYRYVVTTKVLPDNTTDQVLVVTAYNLGKTDIDKFTIFCRVNESSVINVYNKTFTYLRSLDKRQAVWEFDNATTILGVWASLI